jgi:hypothetical protein
MMAAGLAIAGCYIAIVVLLLVGLGAIRRDNERDEASEREGGES